MKGKRKRRKQKRKYGHKQRTCDVAGTLPVVQYEHHVEPGFSDTVDIGHCWHVSPTWYVPGGHATQPSLRELGTCPVGHAEHDCAPTPDI
jgi:hypothetical protein